MGIRTWLILFSLTFMTKIIICKWCCPLLYVNSFLVLVRHLMCGNYIHKHVRCYSCLWCMRTIHSFIFYTCLSCVYSGYGHILKGQHIQKTGLCEFTVYNSRATAHHTYITHPNNTISTSTYIKAWLLDLHYYSRSYDMMITAVYRIYSCVSRLLM